MLNPGNGRTKSTIENLWIFSSVTYSTSLTCTSSTSCSPSCQNKETLKTTHFLLTHPFTFPYKKGRNHKIKSHHYIHASLTHCHTHSLHVALSLFLTIVLTHSFTHLHRVTDVLSYTHLIYSSFHIIFCSTYSYHAILVWCTSTATRATYGTRWLPKGWEDLDYSQQWGTLYWLEAGREPQKVNLTQTICLRHRKGHQRVFAKFTS